MALPHLLRLALFAGSLFACAHGSSVLRVSERAVVSDARQSLDGTSWQVSNGSTTFPATVPGDLITDMQHANLIGDPLYELNFKSQVWDSCTWTYTLNFTLAADVAATKSRYLVLDGIKMVSDVFLNGVSLGYTSDQFLRYVLDVSSALHAGTNTLTVSFPTGADTRNSEQRWMSCSGGWVRAGGVCV